MEKYFQHKSTLWPPTKEEKGLFGRAVAFSHSRIAVAAENVELSGYIHHNNNYTGVIYVYDYNALTDSYEINKGTGDNHIIPQPHDQIRPGTLGSRLIISSNGKTILAGAPYSDIRTDFKDIKLDPDYPESKVTYSDGEYYSEVGALYLFEENSQGIWEQKAISIPKNVICLGGYGRSMSGAEDLSSFVGAYYNKIGKGLPTIIGQVFVTQKTDSGYNQRPQITPPPEINNVNTQRFGASLSFHQTSELYITTLAKNTDSSQTPDKGGVYEYQPNSDQEYEFKATITVDEASQYQQFGIKSTFLGDKYAAIYAEKTGDNPENTIFMIKREQGAGTAWPTTPFQKITFTNTSVSDLYFCSPNFEEDDIYLAVIISADPNSYINIYLKKKGEEKFLLFQTINDPRIVDPESTLPYDLQNVTFASDFSWDRQTCTKFVIGAMGKNGQYNQTTPNEYSRAYVYELKESGNDGKDNLVVITVSCVCAAVVLVIIIVVTIVVIRRRKVRDDHINIDAE